MPSCHGPPPGGRSTAPAAIADPLVDLDHSRRVRAATWLAAASTIAAGAWATMGLVGGSAIVVWIAVLSGLDNLACIALVRTGHDRAGRLLLLIAVTADAMVGTEARCPAGGRDDSLSKPLTPRDLGRVLVRWLSPVSAD